MQLNQLSKHLVRFLKSEDGPTAVEYAIMLALIVMVCFASIIFIGGRSNEMFDMLDDQAFENNEALNEARI